MIDPEIELLAKNRDRFEAEGIIVLAPSKETAAYCLISMRCSVILKRTIFVQSLLMIA